MSATSHSGAGLSGKVSIVTGASRGIGKAIALELAQAGAAVAVAARTAQAGQSKLPGTINETVDLIRSRGQKAIAVTCDVSREEDVAAMVAEVNRELGAVDILVNNAGTTTLESLLNLSVKRWDVVMGVNLRGTFLCSKAVLPQMVERRRGHILNMSSVLATRIEYSIVYGASKAAIERFTQGLAREMQKHNVAVNAFCPDFTVTEAVEVNLPGVDTSRWQSPEMWAKYAALTVAQDASSLTGRIMDEPALKEIFGAV
ncbi:MAG: SDR family NAD(P)-dependent oxidoreductase [Chloroflexota bacterium]